MCCIFYTNRQPYIENQPVMTNFGTIAIKIRVLLYHLLPSKSHGARRFLLLFFYSHENQRHLWILSENYVSFFSNKVCKMNKLSLTLINNTHRNSHYLDNAALLNKIYLHLIHVDCWMESILGEFWFPF